MAKRKSMTDGMFQNAQQPTDDSTTTQKGKPKTKAVKSKPDTGADDDGRRYAASRNRNETMVHIDYELLDALDDLQLEFRRKLRTREPKIDKRKISRTAFINCAISLMLDEHEKNGENSYLTAWLDDYLA